jgi:hypothetical protein
VTDGRGSEVTYVTLSDAVHDLPSGNGRGVHVNTVRRWILLGALLRDGTRLQLRAVRTPGRWLVEPDAVREFMETLRADRLGTPTSTPTESGPAPLRTRAARRKDAERAARKLDEIGI